MKLRFVFIVLLMVYADVIFAQSYKIESKSFYVKETTTTDLANLKAEFSNTKDLLQIVKNAGLSKSNESIDDDANAEKQQQAIQRLEERMNDLTKELNKRDSRIDYNSLNSLDYEKYNDRVTSIKQEVNQLYRSLLDEDDADEEKRLRGQYLERQKELLKTAASRDSFYLETIKDSLEMKSCHFLFSSKESEALSKILYSNSTGGFSFFNRTGLSIGKNTGSIYTELVNGQMYPIRVSIGAMVASSSSNDSLQSKQDEAFQRLSTYGGNTVIKLEYPLIYVHGLNNQSVFVTQLMTKGSADLPAFGTTSDEWAGSLSFGLNFYADAATSNNEIRFFLDANFSQYFGTNTFKNNLELSSKKFIFGQAKVGVIFNNISISFILPTLSSEKELKNRNVIAGGQIMH